MKVFLFSFLLASVSFGENRQSFSTCLKKARRSTRKILSNTPGMSLSKSLKSLDLNIQNSGPTTRTGLVFSISASS